MIGEHLSLIVRRPSSVVHRPEGNPMSTPYQRSQTDPLSLVAIDDKLLDSVAQSAKSSPRKRAMLRFHEFDEHVQRMLNAVEPGTYVRPHRHLNPPRPEAFVG